MLELILPADPAASAAALSPSQLSPSQLSPSQRQAADGVIRGLERGDCAVLGDFGSDGKTTVLGYVHQQLGGAFIGARKFLAKLAAYEPTAIEEAFLDLLDEHLAEHDLLIVDDLHLIKNVVESCDYVRKNLFDIALTAALESASGAGKKLLFACDEIPGVVSRRGHSWFIQDFTAEDFAAICSAYLKPAACRQLDFEEIHRFAPDLNAHQLRKAALWVSHEPEVTTASFLDYLSTHNLVSNVAIKEVEPVTWNDLIRC